MKPVESSKSSEGTWYDLTSGPALNDFKLEIKLI